MNILWMRFLRSVYRREPIVAFVITAGLADVAIGGLSEHWSLAVVGLAAVGGAIALRLMQHRRLAAPPTHHPVRLLPPQSSRPSLPNLTASQKSR